jgi:hypothetical protein
MKRQMDKYKMHRVTDAYFEKYQLHETTTSQLTSRTTTKLCMENKKYQ